MIDARIHPTDNGKCGMPQAHAITNFVAFADFPKLVEQYGSERKLAEANFAHWTDTHFGPWALTVDGSVVATGWAGCVMYQGEWEREARAEAEAAAAVKAEALADPDDDDDDGFVDAESLF